MPIICYGVIVVGLMVVAILVYSSVMFECWGFSHQLPHLNSTMAAGENNLSPSPYLASTFKYKKGTENAEAASEPECVVCLSGFKDGENVCQLPRCQHSFHYPCIDMWLYSHSDCPLCRAPVDRIEPERKSVTIMEENSREVLLDISILS